MSLSQIQGLNPLGVSARTVSTAAVCTGGKLALWPCTAAARGQRDAPANLQVLSVSGRWCIVTVCTVLRNRNMLVYMFVLVDTTPETFLNAPVRLSAGP